MPQFEIDYEGLFKERTTPINVPSCIVCLTDFGSSSCSSDSSLRRDRRSNSTDDLDLNECGRAVVSVCTQKKQVWALSDLTRNGQGVPFPGITRPARDIVDGDERVVVALPAMQRLG